MSVLCPFAATLSHIWRHTWLTVVSSVSENPFISLALAIASFYVCYYFLWVIGKPEVLVQQNSSLHRFLIRHCPCLSETYSPPFWCHTSTAQTIMRPVITKLFVPAINYERKLLHLPDGGVIALDYYGHDVADSNSDIVMLMVGLTGCSRAEYIVQFCTDIRKLKKRAVVVNYRGMGGVPLKTARTYSSTHPEDFEFAVRHVREENPNSKIMGLGISLGGMILTHYLRKTKDNILCAGMAISPAWNANESSKSLEEPINWFIFNQMLTCLLCGLVDKNRGIFEKAGYNVDHVIRSRSVREFDTRFTSQVFGYKNNEEYYEDAAFNEKLHSVKVPMLYLNAADDMFCPRKTINDEFLYSSNTVACVVTKKGGHIGFLEGTFPRPATYMNRLFLEYMNAVFHHGDELEKKI